MDKDCNLSCRIRDGWPLIINLVILWIIILILYFLSVKLNQGHFGYILDDAYIHMAMAKHFAQEGVWGVTKYGFSSSTSSILWVLLLSFIYYLFGVNEITPFILNIVFATATIILVYFIFKKCRFPSWYNAIALLLITLFTPLPTLIFVGMEHSLQIFLMIALVYISTKTLYENKYKKTEILLIIILCVLLALTRYESLILIGIISLLFLARKKYIYTLALLLFSTIPLIIFGAISTSNGWLFLPNSLIVKSYFFSTKTSILSLNGIYLIIKTFITNLKNPTLVIIIFMSICLFLKNFIKKNSLWEIKTIYLTIFIPLTLAFLITVENSLGGYHRYDAFIIALGIFIYAIVLREYVPQVSFNFDNKKIPKYLAILLLITLIISSFGCRGYSMVDVPQATNNIYEQQYQMGLFLKEYYTNEPVAISDIGAVNYLSDIKCLDLWALGSLEPVKYAKIYTQEDLNSLTKEKNITILIIYEETLSEAIPNGWAKVGNWKLKNNKACAYDEVTFYATNPEERLKLIKNLKEYSIKLPSDIEQKGEYLKVEK